jgi:hypothetical protein
MTAVESYKFGVMLSLEIIVLGVTVEIRNAISEGIDYFVYFTVNCGVLIIHLCNVEDE